MAKYDWEQLEREFIVSEFKSVSKFLKEKGITQNGNTKKYTKGWKDKKGQKEYQKSTKIIEKITEKQINEEVEKALKTKDLANELMYKIQESMLELNKYIVKSTHKKRTITYDKDVKKPKEENIEEKESISEFISIIDRKGLKELTSALKDLNEILNNQNNNNSSEKSLADIIQEAYKNKEK